MTSRAWDYCLNSEVFNFKHHPVVHTRTVMNYMFLFRFVRCAVGATSVNVASRLPARPATCEIIAVPLFVRRPYRYCLCLAKLSPTGEGWMAYAHVDC